MNATAIASRLIGDIFVDEGLITDEQLEQALDEQQTTGQRLGEVLITRFGISRLELASALAEQLAEHERCAVAEGDRTSDSRDLEALSSEWSTAEGKPVDKRPIGQIFVECGTASEEQLEQALQLQRETGQRLGEILVEQGVLSRVELTSALSEQLASLQHRPPSSQPDEAPGGAPAADAEPATPRIEPSPVTEDLRTAIDQLEGRLSDQELRDTVDEATEELKAAVAELQARVAEEDTAAAAAGERLDQVERRLADAVTPAQLSERVHSLTSGMLDLSRLIDELAGRLSLHRADGIDTVAGDVKELRAQLADHGHEELVGVVDRVAELERRLSAAATSAELDERLERALTAHAAELGSGLDALAHSMEQVASSGDLNRLRRTVDLLSKVTAGANELAARRLEQLEARTEEAAAADERLQAALTETADRSGAADERLRESLVEVADRTERRLTAERTELQARLGEAMQKLQIADAENLSSLHGSIEGLAVQLAEQRRRLEAQARTDVERLDGRIEQQEARAEEHAADAARATELLEQEMQRLESELRGRLERHADRIDEQRRRLEDVRDAGEHALEAAAARLTQRLADVEQHAVASSVGLKADLGQLGEKVAGQAVEAAQESAAARADLDRLRSRLEDLTGRLEGHEHRTVEDTAEAQKELDEVRSGIGALGDRLDVYGGTTTRNLDAVRKDLGRLQVQVEQLAVRLGETARAADATTAVRSDLESLRESLAEREAAAGERLRSLVERASACTDEKINLLAERSTVEVLRERVDEHDERLADSSLRDQLREVSAEFGRRLGRLGEEVQKRNSRIESGRQEASDELELASASLREEQRELAATLREEQERSASSLREEVGERERRTLAGLSEHRTSLAETSDELAGLRQDVVESDRQRRQGDEALDARIDETRGEVAMVLKKVAEGELKRRRGDDVLDTRIDGLEQQLASESAKASEAAVAGREALRNGLALIAGRLEQVEQRSQRADEGVSAAIGQIERGLTDVAIRSAAHTAESQRDLRAELAKTADSHTLLRSHVEELSRSHEVRLARAEEALQSLGVDELRAQVAALQSQVDAQALQARAQAEAAEQLRDGFVEIGSKLFERQQTFQAAGEELRSTFEELGQTIGKADEQAAQRGAEGDEEPAANGQTFVAFAPDDDNRYTMVECSGEQPAVGARLELAGIGGGVLVVTRVTDSPLAHDTRPCVYLERAS